MPASDAAIVARPESLELRRGLLDKRNGNDQFSGTVRLRGEGGVEVLAGDGELIEAVDADGGDLGNPRYRFGKALQRVPLISAGIALADPVETERQGPRETFLSVYFAERGAATVIARLRIRATVQIGDGSRRIVSLGRWPAAIGPHPDLPGAPVVAADKDGQLRLLIDTPAAVAWRAVWLEVDGKPAPGASGGGRTADGRTSIERDGRVPDGAEVKAQLTTPIGERVIDIALGPWGFPGHAPPPASQRIPVEVSHAP